jgi:molybdenum cofactor cytidylyltransferase
MIFADLPVAECEGALLVHGAKLGKLFFKKGRVLSAADLTALREAGHATITVARLEPGDVGEDEAAARIAAAIMGPEIEQAKPFTGRCNLFARAAGLAVVDRARLDRLNSIDEAITVATLSPFDRVSPREMVATVKIIPFAVGGALLDRAIAIARESGPLLRVAPFRPRRVALIQTLLPGLKESVLDKTVQAIAERIESLGCLPPRETRCPHETAVLAQAIAAARAEADLLLIASASAITDRRDVIPAAIQAVGGNIDHFGMPVDPGNLLLLGRVDATMVLGLPGCARSPKVNGFDWVLQRLIADLPVGRSEIMAMGAGGLLKEIALRPQPRAGTDAARAVATPRIAALVMAAGRSSRMGAANKLLAEFDGVAMVRRVVEAALASSARPVTVVTGHDQGKIQAALRGCKVSFVHNPDFAAGMSASLKRGFAALPAEIDGAIVCLADMPRVSAGVLDRLIAAFNPLEGRAICVPAWRGKRGNPVLWARRFFTEMGEFAGDVGAKHLIGEHADLVAEVDMPDDAVLTDIDTPEALAALRREQTRQA